MLTLLGVVACLMIGCIVAFLLDLLFSTIRGDDGRNYRE